MTFTRYRVTDEDGTFLDEFTTNAADFAEERIGRLRSFYPNLEVVETPDDS